MSMPTLTTAQQQEAILNFTTGNGNANYIQPWARDDGNSTGTRKLLQLALRGENYRLYAIEHTTSNGEQITRFLTSPTEGFIVPRETFDREQAAYAVSRARAQADILAHPETAVLRTRQVGNTNEYTIVVASPTTTLHGSPEEGRRFRGKLNDDGSLTITHHSTMNAEGKRVYHEIPESERIRIPNAKSAVPEYAALPSPPSLDPIDARGNTGTNSTIRDNAQFTRLLTHPPTPPTGNTLALAPSLTPMVNALTSSMSL